MATKYFCAYGATPNRCFEYPFTSIKEGDIKPTIDEVNKNALRKELNIKGESVVLSVGQFIPRKGFDVLIKAMKEVETSSSLYIVGGEPTEEYTSLRDSLNLLNVHFIGFKSKLELEKYYMCADVFVLPTREDIWGLVINEAMSYGLPVIATDKCNAAMELIENGINGYIVEAEDKRDLSRCINTIISDKDLRKKMNSNNLVKIRNYTIEKMAQRHMKIFEKTYGKV